MSYGQTDDFAAPDEATDEFDLSEPAFEINSSQGQESNDSKAQEPAIVEDTADQGSPASDAPIEAQEDSVSDPRVMVREEVQQPIDSKQELVEVRSRRHIFLPYKQRQQRWGLVVALGAELVTFPNLYSQFTEADGSVAHSEDLFGSDGITAMGLEIGPKYNTSIGSFGLNLGFAMIQASEKDAGLDIRRVSSTFSYYLDTIWSEPYFVPYFGVGAWQAEYSETAGFVDAGGSPVDMEMKYSSEIGYHWRLGGLINLDWLEPKTALRSRRNLGLQATFLNLYATSTYMSESSPDPDLESEMDFGASLLLEF